MNLEILHRPEAKRQRLKGVQQARADDAVGTTIQATPSATCADQRPPTLTESRLCERSRYGTVPSVSKVDGTGNENQPKSFDALATHLNAKFERLAADIEKMRQGLRDAEERSEQLKRRLISGKLLSSL